METFVNMAAIIQGYLSQIGITAEITPYEAAMFKSLQNDPNTFDMVIDTFASTDYMVNVWKLFLDSRNYNGHTVNFVTDSRLQSLLEQCVTVQGHTAANIDALHTYLYDIIYAYGLAVDAGFVVSNKRVTGVFLDSRNCIIPGACSYDFSK
jgi:ABC-type transport system substrate-binding protein